MTDVALQIGISLISGLFGAVIGGFATYKSVDKAHENNLELRKKKLKEEERAVVLSIAEELKVIREIYEPRLDECFNQLRNENDYLNAYYIVTQDFFTVYANNADKLGIISDNELRNLIVQVYIYMKKLIEDFNILKMELDESEQKKNVYGQLIDTTKELKYEYNKIKEIGNKIIEKIEGSEIYNARK